MDADIARHLEGRRVTARDENLVYKAERLWRWAVTPSAAGLHHNWPMMVSGGTFGAIVLARMQMIEMGIRSSIDGLPIIVAMVIQFWFISLREKRRLAAGHSSAMDRQSSLTSVVISAILLLMTAVNAFSDSVPDTAIALMWNAGLAIWFLSIGLQAARVLAFGGLALVASMVVAMLNPQWLYGWLAAGVAAGVLGPGIVLGFRNPDIRDLGEGDGAPITLSSGGRLTSP